MSGSRGGSSTSCHCLRTNLEDGVGVTGEEQSLDEGTGLDVLPCMLLGSK